MAWKLTGGRDVYLEIAEKHMEYIRLGIFRPGDKLPSVRVRAEELGVNPNTVAKAYAYLRERGYICSLPKKGVFIVGEQTAPHETAAGREKILALKEEGVSRETLLMWIHDIYGGKSDDN